MDTPDIHDPHIEKRTDTRINSHSQVSSNAHWAKTRRLTAILLAIWLLMTLAVIVFARELSQFSIFGWPVSFYMAAQGCVLVYVLLTGVYAWTMQKIDAEETGNADGE